MRTRRTDPILYLIGALYLILGSQVTSCVRVTTTQNQDGPTGSTPVSLPASPAASPSNPPPPVATVVVGEYAREGGQGPCGTGVQLRVGCAAFITCTPRDGGGVDVGPRYVPEWTAAGAIAVNPTTLNIYNARVSCDSGGIGIAACAVGGKVGSTQYDCVP